MRLSLIALCLLSLPLHAEVFWRLPKRSDATLRQLGGVRVYATGVQVNGAPGTLTAHTFASPAPQVGSSLARQYGLPPASRGGGAALLTHSAGGRLTRHFVIPGQNLDEGCVVLSFDQSLRDAARAGQTPPAWPDGLPALDAAPVFTAVCSLTRTTFVTAETPASPAAATQEAARSLTSAGWTEALPSTDTFRLFALGRKQCVLLAASNPGTGQTTISLLQREGATP